MIYKECARCHRILDDSHFSKNKRNKDGLHSYCRECNALKAKEYNKKMGGGYTAKYSLRQRKNGYFRFGHGAFVNMKKSSAKRGIEFLLTEEELKEWWLSTPDVCFFCGIDEDEYLKVRDFVVNYNGDNETIIYINEHVFNKEIYKKITTMTIDRVESGGPYSVDNIVKSCWICNSIKSNSFSKKDMVKKGHEILNIIRKAMKNG